MGSARGMKTQTMPKPEAGSLVYLVPTGNLSGHTPCYATVERVGRKYFYISNTHRDTKFRISDWGHDTNFCRNYQLYVSSQVYKSEVESQCRMRILTKAFSGWSRSSDFTLQQLRDAMYALDLTLEEES